jgi:addiction module RelB/DinJ family antitoxin
MTTTTAKTVKTTVITVKTDKTLKEKAGAIAKELGFPLGTVINAFLRQFVKNKTVYFSAKPVSVMTKALEEELEHIENDISQEINISQEFDTMQDALSFLKKS